MDTKTLSYSYMKKVIIWIILLQTNIWLHAQPEQHDGGLVIGEIQVGALVYMPGDGGWVIQSPASAKGSGTLQVTHYTLNRKGKPYRKPIKQVNMSHYDLAAYPNSPFAIYLPPYIGHRKTPSHRLIFSYDADTMMVDIMNIPEKSYMQPFVLGAIHFKPGKYVYQFYGQPELTPMDEHESRWLTYYRYQGITPESEAYLMKYGFLHYTALKPQDITAAWKYVVPQVRVEQPSPYEVFINIHGYFLGQVSPGQIEELLVSPYYQIAYFRDNNWETIPHGIGLDFAKDSLSLASKFYNQRILQLQSQDRFTGSGFQPGKYRVEFVTSDQKIISSREFYLGMITPNAASPYQILYRDSLGFPRYTLDQNDDIFIETPFLPIMSADSTNRNQATHHLRYFDSQDYDYRPMGYPTDPEDPYTQHFIPLVSKRKVYINEEPYTGRIKFAFSSSRWGINSRIGITDIYIIDYVHGSPNSVTILNDVDIHTETSPERTN
jgi:hypothetical protein